MKQMYSVVYIENITKDYVKQENAKKQTAPSNKSNTIPSNNEIEKETEKVNLETKTLNCKNKIN